MNFISLFFNQNFNERNPHMNFTDNSRFKIGKNLLSNRLLMINNKIESQWLNLSLVQYKLKCKSIFIHNSFWTPIISLHKCSRKCFCKLSKFKVEPKSKTAGEYKVSKIRQYGFTGARSHAICVRSHNHLKHSLKCKAMVNPAPWREALNFFSWEAICERTTRIGQMRKLFGS